MKKFIRTVFLLGAVGVAVAGLYAVNTRFPLRYVELIQRYASLHDVDPVLVASIINVESRFRPEVVSPVGASGLMQIMPGTGKWAAEHIGIYPFVYDEMIFDPAVNINIGTWYIRRPVNSHAEVDVALAAYNAGSGNVARWLADADFSSDGKTLDYIPFGETRRYVERVNRNKQVYRIRLWLKKHIGI